MYWLPSLASQLCPKLMFGVDTGIIYIEVRGFPARRYFIPAHVGLGCDSSKRVVPRAPFGHFPGTAQAGRKKFELFPVNFCNLLDFNVKSWLSGSREVSKWLRIEILLQMVFGRARGDYSIPETGTGTMPNCPFWNCKVLRSQTLTFLKPKTLLFLRPKTLLFLRHKTLLFLEAKNFDFLSP